MNRELLGIAQYLGNHPVLAEKEAYRQKYFRLLKHFTLRYAPEDAYACAALALYHKALLQGAAESYESANQKRLAKAVKRRKFRDFRVTYRYVFFTDVCFINSFCSREGVGRMREEFCELFHTKTKKIDFLSQFLYGDGPYPGLPCTAVPLNGWRKNREFLSGRMSHVLITANMSAGKSTLINALVGKRINRTQSDACTAKLHYILNKPFEDGYICEWDYLLDLDADQEALMEDHVENPSQSVSVGAYFRTTEELLSRVCLIDTPGVNSALDVSHQEVTVRALTTIAYDRLIYVMNGENIGTCDDRAYLERVKQDARTETVLFVLNKLDRYRDGEDSIQDTIEKVKQDLAAIGFKDSLVCPVSAYAGLLAKKALYGEILDEDEADELDFFVRKFRKEHYNLSEYYETVQRPDLSRFPLYGTSPKQAERYGELLLRSGIPNLERIIFSNERSYTKGADER